MNVEELLRTSLHGDAENAVPIAGLLEGSIARGRQRHRVRTAAAMGGSVAALATVAAAGVVIANAGPGNTQSVKAATGGGGDPTATSGSGTPWWQTWTTDRHNGPVDQSFLDAARPTYGTETQPENIKVWATGSESDGTDWVMFTSATTGHQIEWLQGWNGVPDFGESTQTTTPDISWSSFTSPTLAEYNNYQHHQEFLIVVGRPGTTAISYAADGATYQPMQLHDGIGVLKIDGYIPLAAKVQLSDTTGIYATGTPVGAQADPTASASAPPSTATATATPTPTDGTAPGDTPPPSAELPVQASPTPTN